MSTCKSVVAILLISFCLMMSCKSKATSAADFYVDPNASPETRTLYTNLKNMSRDKLLFGHQHTTVEGINFVDMMGNSGQSDVLSGVGSYPAIYGFDFNRGDFDQFEVHVENAYANGGVVTYSWHAKNPVTGGNYLDTSGNPVQEILSHGPAYFTYIGWLNQIADLANKVEVNGVKVPIIFRPLHENTGNFFWWGTGNSSPSQYRELWRLTVSYLRDTKNVHNFLYAYSPHQAQYDSRYPGDDWVDIIGADVYDSGYFQNHVLNSARTIVNFAESRNKIAALTEVGPNGGFSDPGAEDDFYTTILLDTIKNDSIANKVAYALVWRNGGHQHFWVPTSGDPAFSDFVDFYEDPVTTFSDTLPDMYSPATTATNGFPYCTPAAIDPDSDGWGWEDSSYSCVVPGSAADPGCGAADNGYPYCTIGAVDPDGDGWGWQNSQSCVVPGSSEDPGGASYCGGGGGNPPPPSCGPGTGVICP